MKFSILIPVYKENSLDTFLSFLEKELNDELYEIIVATADAVDPFVETASSKIKPVHCKTPGRGIQLNEAHKHAVGDVVVMLHADTILTRNHISEIKKAVENGFDMGAFLLSVDSERFFVRIAEFFTNLRTRIFKSPYGDQCIFIKNPGLKQIGGIKEVKILEDVELVKRAKKHKLKIYISPLKIKTSGRRWERKPFLNTLKNRILMLLYFAGVSENKIHHLYYNKFSKK